MTDTERQFDFVIFGASGFTGKYLVEYVARTIIDEQKDLKWAVAGRSASKLRGVLNDVSDITGKDVKGVTVIEADVDNSELLADMCRRTKLVLNCVGPYIFYGEAVVKACIENGSHHIDMSGEPAFLEAMQVKYHEEAQKAKVYIIGAAGYDSIPCETGIQFLQEKFGGDVIHVETFLKVKSEGQEGVKGNIGTWLSAVNGISHYHELKPLRSQLFAKPTPKSIHRLKMKGILFYDSDVKHWCVPFPVTDKSVVNRTQYYNYHNRKIRPIQINTYFAADSFIRGLFMLLIGVLMGLLANFKLGRYLLESFPGFFSFGIFSKTGPTRKQVEDTSFTLTIVGHGYDEKLSEPQDQHSNPPNKKLTVIVSGPEAGYVTTPICMVDAALTVLQEKEKLPDEGGVFTPGAALLKTTLIERLIKHGLCYEIAN